MSAESEESKSFSDNMLLEESSMLFLYAAAVVSLIAIVVICACGCRKSAPKNELLGLAGKVKLTNPDNALCEENQNGGHHSPNGSALDEIDCIVLTETKHRNALDTTPNSTGVVATATRSLPDLPIDPNRRTSSGVDVWEKNGEQNSGGDTGSELYATVEEHKMANGRLNKKVSQSTNAVLERAQSGSYASPTTDDSVSPYACYKKEHPYDKVKEAEHPYAQVTSISKKKKLTRDVQSSVESSTSTTSSRSEDTKAQAPSSPLPPIGRTRRPSWEAESSSASAQSSVRDSIPAAGAISGAVAASNELPYMTPPIITTSAPDTNVTGGPHFSGDSQDSGKGYTCISVREPLSNISRRPTRSVEPSHYATVSDDSDETYEAIEEPAQIYTSGSETYAKIAPIARPEPTSPPALPSVSSLRSVAQSTSVSPNTSQQSSSNNSHTSQRAHSPLVHATADLNLASSPKLHINTNVHSRQSSTSSQISTDHPNNEKQRRTNSPLPKTPEIIDDMYAKVLKMSRKSKQTGGRQRTESLNWSGGSYEDQERLNSSEICSTEFIFPPLGSASVKPCTSDPYESLPHSSVGYERIKKQRHSIQDEDDVDPNYEKIHRKSSNNEEPDDIGYAQIHQHKAAHHRSDSEAKYDNGYERIHKTTTNDDPEATYDMGYERIHHGSRSRHTSHVEDNYERIHREDRDSSNYDVGYEQIHKTNNSDQDSNYDVRYEKIHRNHVNSSDIIEDDDDDPNYEELKTSARESLINDDFDDPNYEVLSSVVRRTESTATNQNKHESAEHNYASINKYNKKKYRQSEPNFPSAMKQYDNNNESTYECMNDCFDTNQVGTPDEQNKDAATHKRSNSVTRIEVEPNVFYSQVHKMKR